MGKLCGNSILQHLKCQTKSLCFTQQWKEAKGEAQRVLTDGLTEAAPGPPPRAGARAGGADGASVVKYRAGCLTRSECSKCSLLLPPPSHPRHAGLSHSYEPAKLFLPRAFPASCALFPLFLSPRCFPSLSAASCDPWPSSFPSPLCVSLEASRWSSSEHSSRFVAASLVFNIYIFYLLGIFLPAHEYVNFTRAGTECITLTAVSSVPSRVPGATQR